MMKRNINGGSGEGHLGKKKGRIGLSEKLLLLKHWGVAIIILLRSKKRKKSVQRRERWSKENTA